MKYPFNTNVKENAERTMRFLNSRHVLGDKGNITLYFNGLYCVGFRAHTPKGVYSMVWSDHEFAQELSSDDHEILLNLMDQVSSPRLLGVKMVKNKEVPDVTQAQRWFVTFSYVTETVGSRWGADTRLKPVLDQPAVRVNSFFEDRLLEEQ